LKCIMSYLETNKMTLKPKQFMIAYTIIVRLCDEYDMAADLYIVYMHLLADYITQKVYPAIQAKVGDSRELLAEYVYQWEKFTVFTFSMKKLFEYLDRYYLKNGSERCQNLVETALNQFKDKVFKQRMSDLRWSILEEIKKDRESEITDKDLIKQAIMQFIYMGFEKKTILKKLDGSGEMIWVGEKNLLLYDQDFEAHLKTNTREYFQKKAEIWS
jgi:hypothetical protein